jgi:transcription initiation factor TFIIIB Brf1 subunit/transcription initiation factor TFIIB
MPQIHKEAFTGIEDPNPRDVSECTHPDTAIQDMEVVCMTCGTILTNISFTDNLYGENVQNHYRKTKHIRSIHPDIETLQVPPEVEDLANEMYLNVTKNLTQKGDNRKGIICSCLKQAYMRFGIPMTMEKLAERMNIRQRHIYKGCRMVADIYPEDISILSASDLIAENAALFNLNQADIAKIQILCKSTLSESTVLKRSKPQSVAAGLVYFYIRVNKMDVPRAQCAQKVRVSEITLQKIAKVVAAILGEKVKL